MQNKSTQQQGAMTPVTAQNKQRNLLQEWMALIPINQPWKNPISRFIHDPEQEADEFDPKESIELPSRCLAALVTDEPDEPGEIIELALVFEDYAEEMARKEFEEEFNGRPRATIEGDLIAA